jgi:hypothetical protein
VQSIQEWLCAGEIPGEALIRQKLPGLIETDLIPDGVREAFQNSIILPENRLYVGETLVNLGKTLVDLRETLVNPGETPLHFDHLAISFAQLGNERRLILDERSLILKQSRQCLFQPAICRVSCSRHPSAPQTWSLYYTHACERQQQSFRHLSIHNLH